MTQRHLLTALLAFTLHSLSAQHPGGVGTPAAWAKGAGTVSFSPRAGMTYVGVCQMAADCEQSLWSLEGGSGTTRIQTTARTADLARGTFMNYAPDSLPAMRLYSYTTSSGVGDAHRLHVGNATSGRAQAGGVGGRTVEYAVYGRRLSDQERRRVESYMALKYGITLSGSYLNSRGQVIWNGYANKPFGHRIAGIVADAPSALYQTFARSSEDGHLLAICATDSLSDGQSLLWGDDNGKLAFSNSKAYGKWLGRRWRTSATDMGDTPVDIQVEADQLRQIQPLADGESWYLAIDPTGTGRFPAKSVQYSKAGSGVGDRLTFKAARLGAKAVLAFRAAKDMFTTIDVLQPDGASGSTGSLDVRVTGGTPPYRMRLTQGRLAVFDRMSSDTIQSADGLVEGEYLLATTDHVGNVATHEFQISPTGIAEIPSDADAEGGDAFFARVLASPHPTTDGHVRVQVELSVDAPLDMTLYALDGARVGSISLPADSYFSTNLYLPTVGVYLLSLTSGSHERTVKLVRR